MDITCLTTFPKIFDSYMNESMMKIAQVKKLFTFHSIDLRQYADGFHKKTDDKPYGGGHGQLMMCDPIFKAYDDVCKNYVNKPFVICCAPFGSVFNNAIASELTQNDNLLFICGHYEGIDHRVYTLADKVISIGDYIVTSGELSSMVIIDAVVRKIPGVLGSNMGAVEESFVSGLLEYPQYTRPSSYRNMDVPKVLLSGNHKKIASWKRMKSIEMTQKYRPDILSKINSNFSEDVMCKKNKKN